MRRAVFILLLTSFALSTSADELQSGKTDYSQKALLEFSREFLRQQAAERIDWGIGSIDIYHFGTHVKLLWLPFLAPLPGTRLKDVATVPNAFELTNTQIARSMPYMPDERSSAVNREIRRVLKMERKTKIKLE